MKIIGLCLIWAILAAIVDTYASEFGTCAHTLDPIGLCVV